MFVHKVNGGEGWSVRKVIFLKRIIAKYGEND